jgi:GAF domain-containing protein
VTEDAFVLAELGRLADTLGPAFAPTSSVRLLEAIAHTAMELFGAAACSIGLLTADDREIVFGTAVGAGADDFRGTRMPSGKGIAGWVATSGQPIAVGSLRGDDRFAADVASQSGYVPDAILAVPVATEERVIGVLEVLDRDTTRPDADRDMRLLTSFAHQAALAIESQRAFGRLGRELLSAASEAADADLAVALRRAAQNHTEADDPSMSRVAALIADLTRAGTAERDLAVRVLEDVLAYATDSTRSRGERSGAGAAFPSRRRRS